jgi:hypothetical protein
LVITLGAFGIASIDKYTNRKAENEKAKIDNELGVEEPRPYKDEEIG